MHLKCFNKSINKILVIEVDPENCESIFFMVHCSGDRLTDKVHESLANITYRGSWLFLLLILFDKQSAT